MIIDIFTSYGNMSKKKSTFIKVGMKESMELNETITPRRRLNRSAIYRYLYHHKGFCSKQTIAQDLDLSLPTVYQNLTELMEAGLVDFSGEQRSTGGRRANGLDIVADARIAIGISLTDVCIRIAAVDLRLHELCRSCIRFDGKYPDFHRISDYIANELETFLNDNRIDRSKLLGVGIAMPAVFSPDKDYIVLAPTLHMQNVRLQSFEDAIPYPVYIQNDANCAGLAEYFLRGEAEDRGLAYLSLQNGVGGAIISDGRLLRGDDLRGGEFGHICVEPDGRPCSCGKRGCLEAYCSPLRITDETGVSLDKFFRDMGKGNREYYELWQDMLRHLATGINNINMVLDCDIVLGGTLSEYMEPWLPQLRRMVAGGNPFSSTGSFVQLSMIKSHSVSLGAAMHFIKKFTESV